MNDDVHAEHAIKASHIIMPRLMRRLRTDGNDNAGVEGYDHTYTSIQRL